MCQSIFNCITIGAFNSLGSVLAPVVNIDFCVNCLCDGHKNAASLNGVVAFEVFVVI